MNDSITSMHANPTLRQRIGDLMDKSSVQNFVIALILLNAALLGLETGPLAIGKYCTVQ